MGKEDAPHVHVLLRARGCTTGEGAQHAQHAPSKIKGTQAVHSKFKTNVYKVQLKYKSVILYA